MKTFTIKTISIAPDGTCFEKTHNIEAMSYEWAKEAALAAAKDCFANSWVAF